MISYDILVGIVGARRVVEEPFIANSNKVVGVNRLDKRRHRLNPLSDGLSCAGAGTRASAASASRLIDKLPGEDTGLIHVATDEGLDVALVGRLCAEVSLKSTFGFLEQLTITSELV